MTSFQKSCYSEQYFLSSSTPHLQSHTSCSESNLLFSITLPVKNHTSCSPPLLASVIVPSQAGCIKPDLLRSKGRITANNLSIIRSYSLKVFRVSKTFLLNRTQKIMAVAINIIVYKIQYNVLGGISCKHENKIFKS